MRGDGSPNGKLLLLGNFSQQIAVIDTDTLELVGRETTMCVEECDYRLRANTHHIWLDDKTFIGAIGDHLYRYDLDRLRAPTQLGAHRLWNAHELRSTRNPRFLLIGDLGPEGSGARQVGIFDLRHPSSPQVVKLPGTVWHVCVHPTKNLGYAATYSIATEDSDYVDWAPAYVREYIFEIDLEEAEVRRSWSSSADFPIHLNSDLELYGDKLYVASGAGHSVVELDLVDFATTRIVDVRPGRLSRLMKLRQGLRNVGGALIRKSMFNDVHLILQTLFVTRGQLFDGVYASRVSPDGRYLLAGNRGYNYIRVMERATLRSVYDVHLPTLPSGLHIGLHHSEMLAGAGS